MIFWFDILEQYLRKESTLKGWKKGRIKMQKVLDLPIIKWYIGNALDKQAEMIFENWAKRQFLNSKSEINFTKYII